MKLLNQKTLKSKLFLLLAGCSLIASLIVGVLFIGHDIGALRKQAEADLLLKARLLGQFSEVILVFDGEEEELEPAFKALLSDQHLLAIAVYRNDGSLLARSIQAGHPDQNVPLQYQGDSFRFETDHISISRPVFSENEEVGAVYLRHGTAAFQQRYREFLLNGSVIVAGAFGVSVLLAGWAARRIVRPVEKLSRLANRVGSEQKYSLRAEKCTDDEIGNLVEHFNEMLAQIEDRDTQLQRSQDELEERVRDRTHELEEKQEELSTSERRFRVLFEGCADAIVLLDPERERIVDCNTAALELFGVASRADLGRLPIADISSPNQPNGRASGPAVSSRIAEAMEQGHTRFEWVYRKPSGEDFPCDVLLTAMKLGEQSLIQGIVRDISVQKAAEREIMAARDHAEEANRAKSEFLSRMSHELRTPLNSIIGFSELLGMADLPEPYAQNSKNIYEAGNHLLELINEVLDISRIESGTLNLSTDVVNINELIDEVVTMVTPLAVKRQVAVEFTGRTKSDVFVEADRQRLRQVLINLASNGIKYNRDSGQLEFILSETKAGNIRIEVCDTGMGIPEKKLKRLFTPFDRLDAERSQTEIEGTGLGLALTRKLLEAMNGSIDVHSVEGQGSIFSLELTSVLCPLPSPSSRKPAKPERSRTASNTESIGSILYIEDTPVNLQLVQQIMKCRPKVSLLTAMDGEEGLRVTRESQPDLVLLDYHLPDLNGDDVLVRMKSDPDISHIPVYMLTADAMSSNAERLKALGADDYLTKPINVKEFLKMIDRYFSHRDVRSPDAVGRVPVLA